MRLLTAISIASLVVSIAAVVFVLGLYAELDKSEPETPLVKKEHTQELNESIVQLMIRDHAEELIELAGITEGNYLEMEEVYKGLPGYRCFWAKAYSSTGVERYIPQVFNPGVLVTYNYIKGDDVWLLTTYGVYSSCKQEIMTWTIDDNTGEITYGRPGD